jgi:hypothetical protein
MAMDRSPTTVTDVGAALSNGESSGPILTFASRFGALSCEC